MTLSAIRGTEPVVVNAKFLVTFEEPSHFLAVHLVSQDNVASRAVAVGIEDPSRPRESLVRPPSAWRFSAHLQQDFLYSPELGSGAIWSLDPATLRRPVAAVAIEVHPWDRKLTTVGLFSAAWLSASNDAGHVSVYRTGVL